MFFTDAFADVVDNADPTAGSTLLSFAPLVIIFIIFYFFAIRPQQKKMKDHSGMVESIARGDRVVTSGGIVGKITKVDNDKQIFSIEISDGVEIKLQKSYVVSKE